MENGMKKAIETIKFVYKEIGGFGGILIIILGILILCCCLLR